MGELRTPAPDRSEIQIEQGIFQVTPEVLRFHDGFANFYLLQGSTAGIVIDTGLGTPPSMTNVEKMAAKAPPIAAIILTHGHPDHNGGAKRLSFTLGARVIDGASKGEVIKLGDRSIQVVPGKGHTRDSQYIVDLEKKVVFTGDNILGDSSADVRYMADYMAGLENLLGMEPEVICPGHGRPSYDAVGDIRELIEHRKEREQQILDAVQKGANTPTELFWTVYGIDYKDRKEMATRQIEAHLEKLKAEGRIVKNRHRFIVS